MSRAPRRSPQSGASVAAALGRRARAALAALGLVAPLGLGATASAAPAPAEPVLYAQKGALWLYEDKSGQKLADLPPDLGPALSLQTDPAAKVALIGSDVRWYWTSLRTATGELGPISFHKLPCAAGRARLAPDGSAVLCSAPTGASVVLQLPSGKTLAAVPSALEQTALVLAQPPAGSPASGAELRLVWSDARGVWTAPVATPRAARQVAPESPAAGFSVSPNGERALGVFTGSAHHGKSVTQQTMLYSFALDGRAVRRKAIQHAVPLLWSADARWVLVQDNEAACIMAAFGGQYKCWKGYRGVSLSRDGRFALLLGNRAEGKERDAKEAKKSKNGSKDSPKDKGKKDGAKDDKKLAKDGSAEPAADAPKPSIDLTRLSKATHAGGSANATSAGPGASGHTDIDTLIDTIESYDDEGDEPDVPSDLGEGGEGGEGPGLADSGPASSLTGELHLYRAALEGAFTTTPVQLAPSVDGAAAFCGPLR